MSSANSKFYFLLSNLDGFPFSYLIVLAQVNHKASVEAEIQSLVLGPTSSSDPTSLMEREFVHFAVSGTG